MKKKVKSWAGISLILLLLIIISGCSGQASPEESGSGESYDIGVAIYQYNDNFMTEYRNELEDYFVEMEDKDENNYNVDFQDGKNDQPTQTQQIKSFIAQDKDLIIANLVDPTGADLIVELSKSADIPILLINREPPATTMELWPGKSAYVGVDARQSGIYQGEIIAELDNYGDVNGDGIVNYLMIMGDAGNVDAEQRTQYSVETLAETIEVNELSRQRGNWDEARGQQIAANALSQYGEELEVIFSNNDGMAKGAKTAIDSAGRTVNEDIYIVGVDALPEIIEMIGADEFTGTVLNDAYNQAQTTGDVALQMLEGEEVNSYYWHDYVKVTNPDDADVERVAPVEQSVAEYRRTLEERYGVEADE